MKKKWKKGLWVTIPVLTTTAVVAPISCVVACANAPQYIDDTDVEYGVSSATYNNMKDQFKTLYKKKLETEWTPADVKKNKLEELDVKLQSMDELIENRKENSVVTAKNANGNEEETQNALDYTHATTGLTQLAYDDYDLQLTRESTITWEDFRLAYDGFRDSNEIYMHNLKFDPADIARILAEADKKFNDIMAEMQNTYHFDALSGYLNGMPKLLYCFEQSNIEIAALGASERLKDFIAKFNFVFNEDYPSEGNRYDKIESQLTEDKPISKENMNKMFKCVEIKTGNVWTYDPDQILPGYHLEPILHSKNPNPYENEYTISIDWSIVAQVYAREGVDPKIRKDATAYLYSNTNWDQEKEPDLTIPQILAKSEHAYMDYTLYPSTTYEKTQLVKTYFNNKSPDGMISFKWNDNPKSEDNKYEQFYSGIAEGESTGKMSITALGRSGLLISSNGKYYNKVSDMLDKVGLDKDIEPERLPLDERFLRNCAVESNVTIVDPASHKVDHDFVINYSNTVNPKAIYRPFAKPLAANGYIVSPEFFAEANKAYNEARRWVDIYRLNNFQFAYKEATRLKVTMVSQIAVGVAYNAYYIFKIIFPPYSDTGGYAMGFGFGVCTLAVWGVWCHCIIKHMVKPLEEYYETCKQLQNAEEFVLLDAKLKDDEKYFCYEDENGNHDTKEYDEKYLTFGSADFEKVTRPLYQFYTHFDNNSLTKNFKALIDEKGIDCFSVMDKLGPWITVFGYWNIFSAGKVVLCWLLTKAFNLVLINPAEKWWVRGGVTALQLSMDMAISFIADDFACLMWKVATGEDLVH